MTFPVAQKSPVAQTLSPGFFDPIDATSLQVTIPDVVDVTSGVASKSSAKPTPAVDPTVVTRFMAIFFPTGKCACSAGKPRGPFEKIYSY